VTGDEPGAVRCEERHRVRDVGRSAHATGRHRGEVVGHVQPGVPLDRHEPGATALTVMPDGASSRAHAIVNPIWACFAAT
jgi:hypothetical protein